MKTDEPFKKTTEGHEQKLAVAVAEYLDLQSRGQEPELNVFCLRYPDLAPVLKTELQEWLRLDGLLAAPQPATIPDPEEELPAALSGLKILGEIGRGGMGRVLLALDERLQRKVAVKILNRRFRDDEGLRARFLNEARAMARLRHANVVSIYSLGQAREIPHFVMEYVEGLPLTEAVRVLPLKQKLELFYKVLLAVEFLHRNHVIHRDLKPGNVLVGPDLEPTVLDFGLALRTDEDDSRLTAPGDVFGTPDYFSPEQAGGKTELDARSDIFSLGTILYELLTGKLPFTGDTVLEQIQSLRVEDPLLPRRHNDAIPGDIQNICLKALEKDPRQRYGTAREMAEDVARFLAGEPVLASPTFHRRLMSGKIEQHLRELVGWKKDRILSDDEFDGFKRLYDRLIEREDAWIMEVRRLSLPQVSLYLGAWVLVVGASLIFLFHYPSIRGVPAVLLVTAAALPTLGIGLRSWQQHQRRIGVAYLLAFCLLLPVVLLVMMSEWQILTAWTRQRQDLELFALFASFKSITNAQLWWSLFLSLPVYYGLRRFTASSVFSLVLAVMLALLSLVTLLRLGLMEWIDEDPGLVYLRCLPIAVLFFAIAFALEKIGQQADSRHFYPVAVLFTFVGLSGTALYHEPYAQWLANVVPLTRGRVEYLFIINAGIYLALQNLGERLRTPQTRWVAKSFRFVIPGHVMTSMLLLGLTATDRFDAYQRLYAEAMEQARLLEAGGEATTQPGHLGDDRVSVVILPGSVRMLDGRDQPVGERTLRLEARFFEIALPGVALLFVFGSIPKQMKNFLATGLLFLAVGIVRLQQNLFREHALWPVALLVAGSFLMLLAARYPPWRMALARLLPGRRKP